MYGVSEGDNGDQVELLVGGDANDGFVLTCIGVRKKNGKHYFRPIWIEGLGM